MKLKIKTWNTGKFTNMCILKTQFYKCVKEKLNEKLENIFGQRIKIQHTIT